jgi:arginase
MGRGPEALRAGGLVDALVAGGHAVDAVEVVSGSRFPTEVGTAFEVADRLAEQVRAAVWKRAFPLVLSGNCMSAVGTIPALGADDLGVVWLDAHGDFQTPESSTSGFLDGMALSVATGGCWTGAASGISGFRPVAPGHVVLVGARDFDPGERERFVAAGGRLVAPAEIASRGAEDAIGEALDALPSEVRRLYVHLDLDVLDAGEGRANALASPGGLRRADVSRLLEAIVAGTRPVAGAALSAYDPAEDRDGRVREAGVAFATALLGSVELRSRARPGTSPTPRAPFPPREPRR